jgi:DNA-directed RNA polymerase specialized sigma24 family protein
VYRQLILAGSDQPDESMVSKSPLPDEDVALLERQAHLEHALSLIDPRCRTLLAELFFAPEERSYRDIARKLRIPVNSLGPTRIRCLKKLKKILEELGYL